MKELLKPKLILIVILLLLLAFGIIDLQLFKQIIIVIGTI